MALSNNTQNVLRTQYFDDYYTVSSNDASALQGTDFDFHRILFRPRYPVQSRELTQMQTLLQTQLERLGKAEFRDGEAVIGGQLTLDTAVISGQVLPTTNLVALFSRANNTGKFVFDQSNEPAKAHILQFLSADEGLTSNSYVMLKLQSAETFLPGTVIQASDDATVTATFASGANTTIFQKGSVISIDEGVYFISGFFVHVPRQTIVLNPFSDRPSYRVGFDVAEEILDELDDTVGDTLLDPANQNAPGAHRFRIKLTLAKKSIDSDADAAFIELCRVIDGVIQRPRVPAKYVRLDELTDILARRTFDESGDYIIKSFTPVIETNPDDNGTFLLSLGPGKAYVRGYEIATTEPIKKVVRKGRATALANARSIPATVGNFVYVSRVQATQPSNYFANTTTVDLHCVNVASINSASNTTYGWSKIGTAKLRMLEPEDIPANTAQQANNSVYKMFFYDVQNDALTGNVISSSLTGGAIVLSLAVANGLPAVNGAVNGVTIVLGGTSSPVTGTFTVNAYANVNATHVTAQLKEFLPTLPNGNTTYRLLFQNRDVDAFALRDDAVTSIIAPFSPYFSFQADVHPDSKLEGIAGATVVSDTNDNCLLYQIPETFVKANSITINTALFTAWVKTSANAQAIGGVANLNFTITVSGNNFSVPTGSLTATTAQENFIIFDQTNDSNGHGQIIQFADTPSGRCLGNVVVTQVGQDYNIAFTYFHGSNTSTTRSFIGLAKTQVAGLQVRQKTFVTGNTTHAMANTSSALQNGQIEFHTLNVSPTAVYSLKTPDVYRISKILYKDSNTVFSNTDISTATDVTAQFTLDDGQRDNSYEYATITPKLTASAYIRPTGRLLVIFDYFQNSGRGYATVDSYLSGPGITYDTIPSYNSAKFGRTVNLRDVLDFRPVRSNQPFTSIALVYAASDTTNSSSYLTSGSESYLMPVSDDVWFGSYEYYLSRIDKIAVCFDGTFKVIEGQDAVSPQTPADLTGSLLLYQLNIPPYTLVNANGIPTAVSLKTFDHKRYTMRDISKMDDRVSHLEYYTALNSLERITRDASITDGDGNERFKNGIVVDSFHGGDVANVENPNHTASIDVMNRELRTAFRSFMTHFVPDTANSTTTGIQLVGDMAIPSYSIASFITQSLATRAVSVNPFDVASFFGTMTLSPAVDTWKSTTTKPAQVIDLGGPTQTWQTGHAPSELVWGEWSQTWSGVTSIVPRLEYQTPPGWDVNNHPWRSMAEISWNDVTTQTNYERQGTVYEYQVTTTQTSLGNQVVDVSVIHRMRARDVVFSAVGLKPAANVYGFFDGLAVTNYIQQAAVLQLESTANTGNPFYMGQTVYVKKAITGTVASVNGNTQITGTGTFFDFELMKGQVLQITQGVNTFYSYLANVNANTLATLVTTANISLSNATVFTLTPVTVADVASRVDGTDVQYTVKVVRATRDADSDSVTPYAITAGSLRPEKMVKDAANTTVGSSLIVPPSARSDWQVHTITGAVCKSGVVRSYNTGTAELRLDTDVTDSAIETPGTIVYFVGGPGAGQSAAVVSYNAAIQTATLDTSSLVNITAGETIYSLGTPKADGFLSNSAVTSGRAGTSAGVLHLQEGAFAVGSRLFRLTDSANNDISNATTSAEKMYTASGLNYTEQETTVTSRNLELVRSGVASDTKSVSQTTVEDYKIQYVDPLAETFLVDAIQYPQGIFLASVDLCFAAVPDEDIPVTVEIRTVVNGYPSSVEILPCVSGEGRAVKTLYPDEVTTTANPSFSNTSSFTRFTLPAPVHLMPGKEYAIVVRSDSNEYTVYTAELGKTVIGSDAIVSRQPYAGSFFKSQNASTWTESPFEDMMFRLNRATWNASTAFPLESVLIARAVAPTSNTLMDSYEFYPHEVQFTDLTATTYEFDIKPLNVATGDLTGQTAIRHYVYPNQWSLLATRCMLQGYGGPAASNNVSGRVVPDFNNKNVIAANTVDAVITMTTMSPDVAPFVDLKKMGLLGIQHKINNMPLTPDGVVITNPGAGYLPTLQNGAISTSATSPNVTGDANTNFILTVEAGDTVVIGGNVEVVVSSVTNSTQFVATANVGVTRSSNTYHTYGVLDANNVVLLTITPTTGTGAVGYATIGRDGKINGTVFSANGSGYLTKPSLVPPAPTACTGYTMSTTTGALEFVAEDAPSGGNSLTRYLTRSVTLADGFEARDIKVTFDAYRPLGSHFYVYYKVLPTDSNLSFDAQPWRLMTMETNDAVVSTSFHQFKEFNFVTTNDRALDGTGDTTDRFKVFAIKVVMASSNTVDVPRIANLRSIALDA